MNIKELADNLGLEEEEYLELLDLLVETGMADLANMETAIEAGNADDAARAAHSMKGASGNLGLTEIYELTKTIEAEIRNNRLESIPEKVKEVRLKLKALPTSVRG
jgi:HPt (histidine-containing phosphotransfer) domain-containing protein